MSANIPDPPSVSYWVASPDFRALCRRKLSASAYTWAEPQLVAMGEHAAKEVAPLAAIADREGPRFVTHDAHGVRVDRVEYHPAYREMERIAYGSGMIAMKYQAHEHSQAAPFVGFALGYLFADRLARLFELTLLVEAGHGEYADRLRARPLGLIPVAHV